MDFICANCSKKFSKKYNVERHQKTSCQKSTTQKKDMTLDPMEIIKTIDHDNVLHQKNNSQKLSIKKENRTLDPIKLIKIMDHNDNNENIASQAMETIYNNDVNHINKTNEENITNMFKFLVRSQHEMQEKMRESQQQMQDKIDKLEKELRDKSSNQTNVTNNNLNITINNYFNRNLDIHKLASIVKGEKWADNYILYTIHKEGKYVEAIMDFLIKPDINASPIRKDIDGNILLYRSETEIEKDMNYQLLEKDTKNIISHAYMKTFDKYANHQDMWFDALNASQMVSKFEESDKEKAELHQTKLNKIHDKILDGGYDCPPLMDLHVNLEKINKYKIPLQSRKNLDLLLRGIHPI